MRCEVLAIGTELLLGQIVDTNSAWIGEQLAAAGIDSFEHRQVGDNQARMVLALRELLDRSDAVIVCGGIGPTQDDLTRDAIAEVMGVALERREELIDDIRRIFGARGRDMPANNLRQADVPVGGGVIPNPIGTAPGLRCEVGGKVVYAVPGVPYEMQQMLTDHVLPDLFDRAGQRAVIRSRSLKTWGASESGLAEMIAHRVDALEDAGNPTIAFLARGIEGIVVRITAKAPTEEEAFKLIEAEEREVRAVIGELVFGVDHETMESEVLRLCEARGLAIGVAESLTGGLIGARFANVPGASRSYRGSIASYAEDVKRSLLGVTAEHVVSGECAIQMAEGARRVLGADVAVSITGVAGPEEHDGQPVGTVWYGLSIADHPGEAVSARMPGDRERIRQFSTISALNLLRLRLLALA